MDELLGSPMKWSALNGIGEVVTPIMKINFRTDVQPNSPGTNCHAPLEIRREGTYPEAGAKGHVHPYQMVNADLWLDNGFKSRNAMDKAHRVILSVVKKQAWKWKLPSTVLDLGCGNGLLARKIVGAVGHAAGVEIDEERAGRAKKNLDYVHTEDIAVTGLIGGYDIIVLMPGRLIEMNAERRENFLEELRSVPNQRILVYAYGDWLKDKTLEDLCQEAGLEGQLNEHTIGEKVEAGMWGVS
jgi:SAM-dependent methyltransferase